MSDGCFNDAETSNDIFNALSFERKLVELVEELRLRRNLENETEKSLKCVMDEKYNEELSWDEQQRRHVREKDDLEQQMGLLQRKLEDKVCVLDDDKSQALSSQKKIQELEGKLNLHNKFQENIVSQILDARKNMRSLIEESKELASVQKKVMENVAKAKSTFREYDLCNRHLQQSMAIVEKKYEVLKKDFISSRSELTILKNTTPKNREIKSKDIELEKSLKKILELENMLFLSRKENEKTLNNFVESNKLLCKFMDKYAETQDKEKQSARELERCQGDLEKTEKKLQEALTEIRRVEKKMTLKEKQRMDNLTSSEVQTEGGKNECPACFKGIQTSNELEKSPSVSSYKSDGATIDFMDEFKNDLMELQQNAIIRQSEMYIQNAYPSSNAYDFKMGSSDLMEYSSSSNSSTKKITFSEILKRKIEVIGSGDPFEFISMKRRFAENGENLKLRENNIPNTELTSLPDATRSLAITSDPHLNDLEVEGNIRFAMGENYLTRVSDPDVITEYRTSSETLKVFKEESEKQQSENVFLRKMDISKLGF